MRWMTVLVMSSVLGCGGKEPEKKVEKEESKGGWGDRLSGLADKAKEVGSEVGDKAKELGSKASDKAKELEIEKHAREIAARGGSEIEGLSKEALELGKELKSKIAAGSKLAKYNYDFSVSAEAESEDDFKKRYGKMKQLDIENYKVGFERRSQHPLGKVYKWQFMIGWRLPDGRTAKLSLFTDDELEELLLATMMGEILPLANLLVK